MKLTDEYTRVANFASSKAWLIIPEKNQLVYCGKTHEDWLELEESKQYLELLGFDTESIRDGYEALEVGFVLIRSMGNSVSLAALNISQSYYDIFHSIVLKEYGDGEPIKMVLLQEGDKVWNIPIKEFLVMDRMTQVRRIPSGMAG